MAQRRYPGASARTRKGPIVYTCPCGERFAAQVFFAVDSAPEIERLKDGTLNRIDCPSCEASADVQVPVVYHETGRLILVIPESARHRELEERARLFETLARDNEPPPAYVLAPEVVFGAAGLRAALTPVPPLRELEAVPVSPLRELEAVPVAPQPDVKTDEHPLAEPPTRTRITVPDPRQTVIERWIAGREGPGTFLVEDQVLLCASLPSASLEAFLAGPIELRAQLHRLPNYPVVALLLVAGGSDENLVVVPLDVARAAHRVVLESLAHKTQIHFEIYDADYLPVVPHPLHAPLEENVRRLMAEARDALDRLAPATRSFERARAQLISPQYDKLGHTPVELPEESETLEKPSSVRAALGQVARWSEPGAEAYLVEIRSLPLAAWRHLRSRVVRRALDAGIAVPRPLVERIAKEGVALPSWSELLSIQVRRFAEVSARQRTNDLSAVEEAENWDLLLRECALAGVTVEDDVQRLAQAAVKRARALTSGAGVDLTTLQTSELVALLERKELRRDAALILCERRELQTLPALFSAIRRMTRAEANTVLPSVTSFGLAAERWLVEGLRSRKSFMRQGSALALGVLKTPIAIDALVRLLLNEPTDIWPEVARALGDVGAPAVLPLASKLREVDAERRERIVQALSHIAAVVQSRSPLEMLAEGRDRLVAAAAQRALELYEEVRLGDAAVRRGGNTEQTIVRGFSRRFYETLQGSPSQLIELDPGDLEEIDDGNSDEEEAEAASDLPAIPTTPRRPRPAPRDQ